MQNPKTNSDVCIDTKDIIQKFMKQTYVTFLQDLAEFTRCKATLRFTKHRNET